MRAPAKASLPENLAEALWLLGGADTSPSMRELVDHLRCDPANGTVLIRQLEQQSFVARVADPCDGRGRIATVTEEGRTSCTTCLLRSGHAAAC